MNNFEYKKAYEEVVPLEELISNTLLKIKKQKRNKVLRFKTCLEIAVAACFCFLVGIGASNFSYTNISTNSLVGSIFGNGSEWVLASLLFAIITSVIVIINNRRK